MSKPGRILCVSSNFPRWPGDSTTPFVLHLAQDLCELGWDIDVLAPHAQGAKQYEPFGKVEAYRFRYLWPESLQTVCYQGGALVNLRRQPWNKLKLPALVAAQFFSMSWRLLSGRYDVIHAHWIVPQGFNAILLGWLFRKPVVVTVHGGDVFGLRGSLIDRFKRFVLRNASIVTVNSDFTNNAVHQLCPACSRVAKIPMGVSVAPLTAQEMARSSELRKAHKVSNSPLLLFVGRLVEEKGIDDLLEALAILVKDSPDVRLLIAGEGQDRARLEASAVQLGIDQNVQFLGWIDPSEVRLYLSAADIFVGPSRTAADGWIEAQGLTFLEAMASGTVVIGTRLGGIKESVIEGQTGFLVDERAPKQIAATVKKLTEEPDLLVEIVESARARTVEIFSRETSARAFSEHFVKLMDETKVAQQ